MLLCKGVPADCDTHITPLLLLLLLLLLHSINSTSASCLLLCALLHGVTGPPCIADAGA